MTLPAGTLVIHSRSHVHAGADSMFVVAGGAKPDGSHWRVRIHHVGMMARNTALQFGTRGEFATRVDELVPIAAFGIRIKQIAERWRAGGFHDYTLDLERDPMLPVTTDREWGYLVGAVRSVSMFTLIDRRADFLAIRRLWLSELTTRQQSAA